MSELTIALHLLDASQTHPLQTWEFDDLQEIRVGRSADNEVQIGHPYVSRAHAILQFQAGGWELRVASQQGVVIEGAKVFQRTMEDQLVFQLGPGGPHLRFVCADLAEPETDIRDTMAFDLESTPILHLDEKQRDEEVDAIIEEPYFQRLQQVANELREKRRPGN